MVSWVICLMSGQLAVSLIRAPLRSPKGVEIVQIYFHINKKNFAFRGKVVCEAFNPGIFLFRTSN
ncbi:MAG: hypothetical protein B6D73_10590 [gamma proteobacterium symbiont of Stewartia floridana]|nr:MAG: hypothetical protein B6D73_10590 [gamma proteobacterium symbiont of Stewartia floridana]